MPLRQSASCGGRLSTDECYVLMEGDTEASRLEILHEIEKQIKDIKADLRLNGVTSKTKRSFDIISNGVLNLFYKI